MQLDYWWIRESHFDDDVKDIMRLGTYPTNM
jgi:hypothetical protein